MVTIYKNLKSTTPNHISISAALKRIRDGKSKATIEAIRDGKADKEILPVVIFSGEVSGSTRTDADVLQHSGFIVLDFDHVDVGLKKAQLTKDSYIYAAWVSPSGDGVKALVKCPPSIINHPQYYNAILSRYPELDTSGKNISRLCYESYDPEIYINTESIVWDKTVSEEDYQKLKSDIKNKTKKRILNIAISIIRNSREGERHTSILKASNLCGGYDRHFTGNEAILLLKDAVRQKGFKPSELNIELKAVDDGYNHGKKIPLHELKEIEKSTDYAKREDGTFDFMADEDEMDDYEMRVITGTLEMGLSTGIKELDAHWMIKKNTLVWMGGISNVGKSYVGWYKTVLAAMFHGWKALIYSKENSDGQVRKKLKEFYIGKSIKLFTEEERQAANVFIKDHYRLFTAKKSHTASDFLLKCEIVYDEGWEFDVVFAEPFNSFYMPINAGSYQYNTNVLNEMQTFKANYSALWVSDHVGSDAARNRDRETGFIKVPWKSDIEMGAMKDNKSDDFIMYHRNTQDPVRNMITETHVQKIKDKETGGNPTSIDEPVELVAHPDLCGFTCNGYDPIKEYWRGKGKVFTEKSSTTIGRMGSWQKDEAPF